MPLAIALDSQAILLARQFELTFVSGDQQLLQAAAGEGLATENPFMHSRFDNLPAPPTSQ